PRQAEQVQVVGASFFKLCLTGGQHANATDVESAACRQPFVEGEYADELRTAPNRQNPQPATAFPIGRPVQAPPVAQPTEAKRGRSARALLEQSLPLGGQLVPFHIVGDQAHAYR